MKYRKYYKGHDLEKEAIEISKLTKDNQASKIIMSLSKNFKDRKEVLGLVSKNYTKLSKKDWLRVLRYDEEIINKILKLGERAEDFLSVCELNLELARKIKEENITGAALNARELASEGPNKYIKQNFLFLEVKYGVELTGDVSNNAQEIFKLSQNKIPYSKKEVQVMEMMKDFIRVGLTLNSCTGGRDHWEQVQSGQQIRFMVKKEKSLEGTVLFYPSKSGLSVYGFTKGYRQYTRDSVLDFCKHLDSIGYSKVLEFSKARYTTHGKRQKAESTL